MSDPGAEARARRRALARLHHPDLGGDPAEFDRVMRAAADQALHAETPVATGVEVTTTAVSRARQRLRTTSKTVVAEVRRRLPRSVPGSRRYGHL